MRCVQTPYGNRYGSAAWWGATNACSTAATRVGLSLPVLTYARERARIHGCAGNPGPPAPVQGHRAGWHGVYHMTAPAQVPRCRLLCEATCTVKPDSTLLQPTQLNCSRKAGLLHTHLRHLPPASQLTVQACPQADFRCLCRPVQAAVRATTADGACTSSPPQPESLMLLYIVSRIGGRAPCLLESFVESLETTLSEARRLTLRAYQQ